MPFRIRVERASPLQIFFPQACEGKSQQSTLPLFLLLHDNVNEALRDFVGHFGYVYLLADARCGHLPKETCLAIFVCK